MGTIYLSQMTKPASSTLAAEDTNNLMIWEIVRTGPLIEGMVTSLESMT